MYHKNEKLRLYFLKSYFFQKSEISFLFLGRQFQLINLVNLWCHHIQLQNYSSKTVASVSGLPGPSVLSEKGKLF